MGFAASDAVFHHAHAPSGFNQGGAEFPPILPDRLGLALQTLGGFRGLLLLVAESFQFLGPLLQWVWN